MYDESDPLAVVPEFPHSSLQPGPILFDQANHDRIVVAFDRLQADMAAWTESAREAGELPGPSYSSGDAQAGPSIGAEKTLLGRIEEGMQFSEGGGPEAAPAGNTGEFVISAEKTTHYPLASPSCPRPPFYLKSSVRDNILI